MMIEIKSLVVCYPGDDTVGMPSRYYEVTGPFQFEDEEAIKEFKEKLSEAFEYVEDGKPGDIVTNKEYEQWDAQEGQGQIGAELKEGWSYCKVEGCHNQVPPMNEVHIGIGVQTFGGDNICEGCYSNGVVLDYTDDSDYPF